MNIHIIGICGTFMGGVARLARELGFAVTGSDANTYPPMSIQLKNLGIEINEGYSADNIPNNVDTVLVGNTISRGNPELEHVLEKGLPYSSGAQWLGENVLQGRWVLAVAGTHGKTTTSSILAWLLHDNGLAPGYLIGGVPENFAESARLGETSFFVIEADEYDTAFCDKRSKFLHYRPRTLVLNNLEFDHADIFSDLAAIQTQVHHLLKTIPPSGLIIHNHESSALNEVLRQGVWSETQSFANGGQWQVKKTDDAGSEFIVIHGSERHPVKWPLIGEHNMHNALAAIAAAHHVGIPIAHACQSLSHFQSVKRRMEMIFENDQVRVFDDFAHHPTAIQKTLTALRNQVGEEPILAVLEPRSNTMKRGIHKDQLASALNFANNVMIYADDQVLWDINELINERTATFDDTEKLILSILKEIREITSSSATIPSKINILIMSNGGFDGVQQRLIEKIDSNT